MYSSSTVDKGTWSTSTVKLPPINEPRLQPGPRTTSTTRALPPSSPTTTTVSALPRPESISLMEGCGRLLSPAANKLTTKKILRIRGQAMRAPRTTQTPRAGRTIVPEKKPRVDRLVIVREREEEAPFPAWNSQIEGIASRAFNDVEKVITEVPTLWAEWGRVAIQAYLSCDREEAVVRSQYRGRCIRPPWRGTLSSLSETLAEHLRVIDQIRKNFHEVWKPQLLFDADEFFHSEKARHAAAFETQLREFVDEAKDILQSKWPLYIGRVLLNEAACWVHLLSEGNEAKKFLDSVAATQATLLVGIIRDNFETIRRCMYADASNAKLLIVVVGEDNSSFGKEKMLLELARIPRVDGKIYPKLFGQEWIDVSEWLRLDPPPEPEIPKPFSELQQELEVVEKSFEDWSSNLFIGEEERELSEWKQIHDSLILVEHKTHKTLPRWRQDAVLFDFSPIKNGLIEKISLMKERLKAEYLDRLAVRNEKMRIIFFDGSRRLFGKGVIEQLSQLSEVQEVLPSLERSVNIAVTTYLSLLEDYDLPDNVLRHCYEISRLGTKLRQLVDFVWRRIELEKEWLIKSIYYEVKHNQVRIQTANSSISSLYTALKVSDESHALYFEAELLDKELESCLHKYRNCHSISQMQRVAGRLEDIAMKTEKLKEKCEVMWIQRRLLQLDEMCMEVPAQAKQARLLATLARVHYDTLSTEEDCLNARVFDLDKDAVSNAYNRLNAAFESFAPSLPEIERESALHLSRVVVESIKNSLGKLFHLIPILAAIRNRNMRSHHWQMVMESDGTELQENPPVSSLLEFNILEKAEVFEEVGVIADKELVVEKSMQGMKNELAATRLQPKAPVDDWLDLRLRLGTQAARCRTLLASLPPAELASQLREWMDTVEKLGEFVDHYVNCSRSWKHVEGVFATDDIAYQMPTEFWTFTRIRQLWQQLNQAIADQPILSYVTEVQQLNENLENLLGMFGNVEAGFNSYLQKKRTAFPRLHLLSHGELLELLSMSRDPSTVSPFMHRLFAGVHSFVMNGRGELTHLRSIHMETYELTQLVNASIYKHHAEKWLSELDRETAKSLRNHLRSIIEEHKLGLPAVAKMGNVPEQIVEIYVLISTSHLIEKAIKMNALKKFLEYVAGAIKEISVELRKAKRIALCERLCSILIQRQQVARILLLRGCKVTDDEVWMSELRCYWNNDHVFVRIFRSVVRFDYELLGVSHSLQPRSIDDFVKVAVKCGVDCVPIAVRDDAGILKEAVTQLARTLGRPLIIPRRDELQGKNDKEQRWGGTEESPQERMKALAKASLLTGGVVLLDEDCLEDTVLQEVLGVLYEMRREIAPTEQLRVRMDDSDLVVSRSALFVFRINNAIKNVHLNTMEVRGRCCTLTDTDLQSTVSSLLRSHSVDDWEKIAREACTVLQLLRDTISWRAHYSSAHDWILRVARCICRILANDLLTVKERQSVLSRAIREAILPSLALEDRILVTVLALPGKEKDKEKQKLPAADASDKLLLAGLSAHATHAPFVRKCSELVAALTVSSVVVLLGPPMAGKTTLIDAARAVIEAKRESSVDVLVFHSDVAAFESFTKAKIKRSHMQPVPMGHVGGHAYEEVEVPSEVQETWLILDAPPPNETIQWFMELINTDAAERLPVGIRVLLETDILGESTSLPLVYVDPDTVPLPLMSPSLLSIMKSFNLIGQRALFSLRRSLLEKAAQLPMSPQLELFIHVITLQSFHEVETIKEKSKELNSLLPLTALYDRFPNPGEDFIAVPENDVLGPPSRLFLGRLAQLLLDCGIMPVISAGTDQMKELDAVRGQLEKSHSLFSVYLDETTSVEHLRIAIHACQLLSGEEEEILAAQPSLLLVHSSSPILKLEMQECMRALAYAKRKYLRLALFIISSPPPCISRIVPPRMDALTFPLSADLAYLGTDIKSVTMVESAVYDKLIGGLKRETLPVGAAEWRRALGPAAERIEYRSVADMLKKHSDGSSSPTSVVRDGTVKELRELFGEYEHSAAELSEPLVLTDSSVSSTCLLEKALSLRAHIAFIGSRGSGRRQTAALAAHLTGFTLEYVGGKTTIEDWEALLEKTIRACLLDGVRTVICIGEMQADEMEGGLSIHNRIHADLLPLIKRIALPARLLSHSLLCQVSDKYSIGGASLWKEMRDRLSESLVFIITLTPSEADIFMDEQPEILAQCVIVWASEVDSSSLRQSASALLLASRLFRDQLKMDQMLDALCKTQEVFIDEGLIGMDAKFIEFVRTFIALVGLQKEKVDAVMKRYERGMEKLRRAEEQIGFLQGELLRLQPELVRTSIETSMLMSSIERESIEVENAREVVAANEYKANEAATKAQALKVESEEDLANALPALEAAVDALETMKQSDVSTLKTMRFPPYGVRICMEAVCILLGEPPARVPNPLGGDVTTDYWPTGQKLLSDIHFLSRIRNFSRDSVPKKTITLIREKYLSKDDFDPEKVKQCSLAAEGLCLWVKAVDLYSRIAGVVQPKKEKLRRAELLVKQHMKQLEVKRKALTKVTERLQFLSDQFSQMSQKKQELQSKINGCEMRMERAERLVTALGGEKQKWSSKMESVRKEAEEVRWRALAQAAAMEFLSLKTRTLRETVMSKVGHGLLPEGKMKQLFLDNLDDSSVLKNVIKTAYLVDAQDETIPLCERALGVGCYDVVEWNTGEEAVWEGIRVASASGRPILIRNVPYNDGSAFAFKRTTANVKDENIIINGVACPVKSGFRIVCSGEGPVEESQLTALNENGVVFRLTASISSLAERTKAVILSRNCADLVDRRDQLISLIEGHQTQLAGLEEEMLDLLGRSQDLDDEKAIDLLQQSKQIQESVETAKGDLRALLKQLCRLETVLTPVFNWAAKVLAQTLHQAVGMGRTLGRLSPWYNFSPNYLVSILDVSLIEVKGEESIEPDTLDVQEMIGKITNLIWNELSPSLRSDHRHVFHVCLTVNNSSSSIPVTRLSDCSSPSPIDADFARILHSRLSARHPLILVHRPSNAGFPDVLPEICTRGTRVLHTVLNSETSSIVRSNFDQPVWVVVSCTQLTHYIHTMSGLIEELNNVEELNTSFRLILIVSSEQPLRRWIERTRTLFVDRPTSFHSFLRSIVLSVAFSETIANLTVGQEGRLVSLIALHFALRTRCTFGVRAFIGQYSFNEYNLNSMLKMFKETVMGTKETQTPSRILHSIVNAIYGVEMESDVDQMMLETMHEWIFVGINKQDDAIAANYLFGENPTHKHQLYKEHIGAGIELCGLSPLLIKEVEDVRHKRMLSEIAEVSSGENVSFSESRITSERSSRRCKSPIPPPTFRSGESTGRQMMLPPQRNPQGRGVADCVQRRTGYASLLNYLLNELESCGEYEGDRTSYIRALISRSEKDITKRGGNGGISLRVDVTRLRHPVALLATLRAMAADQSNSELAETELEGEMFPMTATIPVPNTKFPSIVMSLFLLNAKLDSVGLKDSGYAAQRVQVRVTAIPRRVVKSEQPGTNQLKKEKILGIPIVQPGIPQPLLIVPSKSTIPLSHWILRGVRLLTVNPERMDPVEQLQMN